MTSLSWALATRANELLGDGQWHNHEKVVLELSRVVPPGRAVREAEAGRNRPKSDGRVAPPERKGRNLDAESQVKIGARAIVREFLRNGVAYEVSGGEGAGTRGHDPAKKVRQVRMPAVLHGDPQRLQIDQLKYEREMLRERTAELEQRNSELTDQVDRFMAYLKDNDHADAAERLLAGPG